MSARQRNRAYLSYLERLPDDLKETPALMRWGAAALLDLKRYSEAVEVLRRLVSREDAIGPDYFNLAVGLALADADPASIERAAERARELGPIDKLDHSIGMALFFHGECRRAIPYLTSAFEADPSDLTPLEFAGRAMLVKLGLREAKAFLQPHEEELLEAGGSVALGIIYWRSGDLDSARRHLGQCHRAPWAPHDKRLMLRLIPHLNRGQLPPVNFGCGVMVAD